MHLLQMSFHSGVGLGVSSSGSLPSFQTALNDRPLPKNDGSVMYIALIPVLII